MEEVYFPSCNFNKLAPEAAERLSVYLGRKMPKARCCRVEKGSALPKRASALYFCQACRSTLEERFPDRFRPVNLFVWLLGQDDLTWPDYGGLTATVQDCWRDREHPEIHTAVREALKRMGISILEMEEKREKSVFCGNLHFEPNTPENIALWQAHGKGPLYLLPEEEQRRFMLEQAEKYPCDNVVTYCNRCTSGVRMAGKNGIHLMELIMGTYRD